MKWLIGIVVVLVLSTSGCVTPPPVDLQAQFVRAELNVVGGDQAVLAHYTKAKTDVTTTNTDPLVPKTATELAKEKGIIATIHNNTIAMHNMLDAVKARVGRTWYVFSGASPAGWDCSGLVLWAYEQVGIELPHRASEQKLAGKLTETPQPGDIVSFTYKGSQSAYHVGLYLGEGMMIDAPRPGQSTSIESIDKFAGNYSKVTYTHILDTTL
jgi:cell wall-associated NlpC family hydrolase